LLSDFDRRKNYLRSQSERCTRRA